MYTIDGKGDGIVDVFDVLQVIACMINPVTDPEDETKLLGDFVEEFGVVDVFDVLAVIAEMAKSE